MTMDQCPKIRKRINYRQQAKECKTTKQEVFQYNKLNVQNQIEWGRLLKNIRL